MAKLDDVLAEVESLSESVVAGFADIQGRIDALKTQVGNGGTITEADLDQVVAKIEEVKADLVAREDATA